MAFNESGEGLGRLAVLDNRRYNLYNGTTTAFFYLFESVDDLSVTRGPFERAFEWAQKLRRREILGPKGFQRPERIGHAGQGL